MLPEHTTHSDCAKHEMGAHHTECPKRLGTINDMLLFKGLLDYMSPCDAPLATPEQLAHAHSSLCVNELMAASPAEGYHKLDPDTNIDPYTVTAALRAADAAALATELVLSGAAHSAFCCVRPPGHHAARTAAMGFCFFNNVAAGIRHALTHYSVKKIALIDFDAHYASGSEDIFRVNEWALMCSIFEPGTYPFTDDDAIGPNMVNVGPPSHSGNDAFRDAVTSRWLPPLEAFEPEMIYVPAGFDGHLDDNVGNLGLIESDYEWVTHQIMSIARKHCQDRDISCLEGGYMLSPPARSASARVKVLIGCD